MKKIFMSIFALVLPFVLTGCSRIGSAGASATIIYGVVAVLSLLLLVGCCLIERKRDKWLLLLFSSVLVVNIGYFALSSSRDLEGALMANRIAYLGSVFLPLSMLMIILNVTKLRYKKWLPVLLLSLAAVVFLIAASPGIFDIYYKEVTFVSVCGASSLQKVYGPWHFLYGVHLLFYFIAMVTAIIYAYIRNTLDSTGHAVILAIAVFVNIGVWFVEQLCDFDFEFLSISYIISELFLLGLHIMVAEQQRLKKLVTEKEKALSEMEKALCAASVEDYSATSAQAQTTGADDEAALHFKMKRFANGILDLTQTEKSIFNAYIARMSTKEIMASLHIKENTLKFHNRNLYHKLGVSSRKELWEIYKQIKSKPEHIGETSDATM